MKRIILMVAVLAGTVVTSAHAQSKTSFGVKGEANMSNFRIDDMPGVKSDFGVGAGIGGFMKIDFGEYFALQPELMLQWQNSTLKQNGVKSDFEYWGMEIPVYAMGQMKLESGDRAYIGIGPYGRLGFSARNKTADVNYYKKNGESKPFMQRGDVGAAVLVGYEFDFGMQINASYKYGFLNVLDAGKKTSSLYNQQVSLGIAYRF